MDAVAIMLSAAVGSAATLAWESFAKPRIVGRSLAELLAADLSLQMQNLVAERAQFTANPKNVPLRRPMQTQVFNALIPRLGELPGPVLLGVLGTYRVIERINDIGVIAQDAMRDLQQHAGSPAAAAACEEDLTHAIAMYRRFVVDALRRIDDVQPLVIGAARPWWSVRSWFSARPVPLDASALEKRARELQEQNRRDAARIRGEGRDENNESGA